MAYSSENKNKDKPIISSIKPKLTLKTIWGSRVINCFLPHKNTIRIKKLAWFYDPSILRICTHGFSPTDNNRDHNSNQMLFVIDFMLNHANVNKFFDKCRISYSCDKLMLFLQNNRKTNICNLLYKKDEWKKEKWK